jgi:hypothetical protein
MSEGKASPANPHPVGAPPAIDDQSSRALRGLRNLAERIMPWLVDVGSWIFGGLMAVNLFLLAALVTVGPVDAAIQASTAFLAAALPLNVTGIVLLRLIKDVKGIGLDEATLQAFQDAEFPDIDAYFASPVERAAHHARRSRLALLYSLAIALFSAGLTVTGVAAAVWHIGRWIAVVFLAAVFVSAALAGLVVARTLPPKSDRERLLWRR